LVDAEEVTFLWQREEPSNVLKVDGFLMILIKITSNVLFFGLLILTACSSARETSATSASPTPSSQPTATELKVLPTPSSPGDTIIWRDLQVSMDQAEITDSFITEFGTQRVPSTGRKFLWVHVRLENVGKDEIALPTAENFSVLYAKSEFKPIYGHRQGYADYTDLSSTLFPGQQLDAWLRFDIPTTAELSDLQFVFLPTSAQVGVSPSSPNYPYAENKPTYVWEFGQQ
jgi:hypothetical protein